MASTATSRDELPEEFSSEEEASEFWDTHSIADYEECLEPVDVDVDVDLQRRHFEIEVDEDTFLALTARAKETHRSVRGLARQILSDSLASA